MLSLCRILKMPFIRFINFLDATNLFSQKQGSSLFNWYLFGFSQASITPNPCPPHRTYWVSPVALPLAVAAPTPVHLSHLFIMYYSTGFENFSRRNWLSLKLPHDPVYQQQSGREPFNLRHRQTTQLRFPSQKWAPTQIKAILPSVFLPNTLFPLNSSHSKSPTQYEHIK